MNRLHWSMFLMLFLWVAGCNSASRTDGRYTGADDEPRRNTSRARELHEKALTKLDAGDTDAARVLLVRALEADVTFGPAHNNLGMIHFEDGKLYKAAWEFQYAAKLLPDQAAPLNNLGLVFEKVGKLAQATEQYSKAHEMAPENVQYTGNLARSRIRQGLRDKETKELLDELVLKDTRSDWINWAREQRVLINQ